MQRKSIFRKVKKKKKKKIEEIITLSNRSFDFGKVL